MANEPLQAPDIHLGLNCVDNAGCQYPLGTGRGYLIFDEEQLE